MRARSEERAGDDLARLFGPGGRDDRALLDRYRRDGDGRAFEGLVLRHGPMVLGVCRRALGDAHDADDAFQATFLVLARRARSVRDADRLGPWLFGVARRVAAKARVRRARRRERPAVAPETWPDRAAPGADRIDVPAILDEELARISAKLRAVLVLCLLEGLTAEEAADRLGCPVGTAKSRLARGRLALRHRLEGRGLAPDAGLALLAPAASRVPMTLIRATLAPIAGDLAALAPGVAALSQGIAPAMIIKSTAAGLLLAGLALATAGLKATPEAANPTPPPGGATPQAEGRPDARDPKAISKDHLKQVALGCMNIVNANHIASQDARYPAPAFFGTDGQPKLSWRVALLPYLGEEALFHEFHLTETWNSPHNRALIARMPDVFRTPDSPAPDGMTRFRGFQGRGTMFEGPTGTAANSITDGAFLTAMIVQAAEPTIWTKPGELPVDAGRDLPALDGDTWRMAMADGAVIEQPPASVVLLRALISRNGGEVVEAPPWAVTNLTTRPAPPRSALARPTDRAIPVLPPPGGSEAVRPAIPSLTDTRLDELEARLGRVEAKLDRLIEKLGEKGDPAPR